MTLHVFHYIEYFMVLFVSHQWLSCKSPDPDFKQLSVLIDALQNIISGVVVVQSDVSSQIAGLNNTMSAEVPCLLQEACICIQVYMFMFGKWQEAIGNDHQ